MDELTGKLYNESVQLFMDFLEDIKTKIGKIVIIEHVNNVNHNMLIDIKKDQNLISSLSVIY